MCAHVPDKIFVPSTANANENVIINWNKPIEHGSAITGYKVYIRKSDLTFHYSEHVCDGTTLEALAQTQCSVPLKTFIGEPYNLKHLSSIFARIVAVNFYGDSVLSDAGNGAILFFVPDPPIDLAKNVNFVSSQTAISISWMQAAFNGGRTVVDYRISYD
jgi:hypothetical protein